jgi:hypothetical protein
VGVVKLCGWFHRGSSVVPVEGLRHAVKREGTVDLGLTYHDPKGSAGVGVHFVLKGGIGSVRASLL